ncbi:hypothetical protein IWW45_005086 [Coemansia sp. RSA 485]|nr:hypothetical protein IWW45_005086 [Coemansia sp. RSA 485]
MQLLLAYILGILTLPALVAAGLFVFWALLPPADQSTPLIDYEDEALAAKRPLHTDKDATSEHKTASSPYGSRRTGWLRITRSLESNPPDVSDGSTKITEIVARGFAKWISSKRSGTANKRPEIGVEGSTNTMVAEGLDDLYYVVLDGDTLVMYDGEDMSECRGVIIMTKYRVSLHHRPNTSEAQVYSRKTPIRLAPMDDSFEARLYKRQVVEYYVYVDRPMDKEDWYFALMWSSLLGIASESSDDNEDGGIYRANAGLQDHAGDKLMASPPGSPVQQHRQGVEEADGGRKPLTKEQRERLRRRLRQRCMVPDSPGIDSILQTISARGASAKPGSVREDEWLNAMIGRVFLAAYRTEWARKHFIRKMQTKFDRVEKPMFLDRIIVADLDIGDNVPVITVPKLECFNKDGTVDISMYMHYMGGFKLVLNTGVKIGSLRMSVSLSVVLHSLAGRMLLRFKPAPSNRFWLGFYEMPSIRLSVAPVFMQKQVKYAAVSQAIEKQIYDIVRTTLVYPNLDDTVFFPTTVDEAAVLETVLKEYYHAGLDSDPEASAKPADQMKTGVGAQSDLQSPAAENSGQAAIGGGGQTARKKDTGGGPRPFSMTSVELGMDHINAPTQLSAAIQDSRTHRRGDSMDANYVERGLDRVNSSLMVTPQPLTSNCSETDIDQQQQGRFTKHNISTLNEEAEHAVSERSTSPSTVSVAGSQTKAASIKSTISASAAMFFKRAKDSQAAESAKTWWQNIQQNTGNASPPPVAVTTNKTTGYVPALPPRQATDNRGGRKGDQRLGIGVQEQMGGQQRSVSATSNRGVSVQHYSEELAQPAAIAVGFGPQQRYGRQADAQERVSSQSPQTYGSSITQSPVAAMEDEVGGAEHGISSITSGFQFPRINDGAINGGQSNGVGGSAMMDSALVRRRPAALSHGSEIELPIQRRYSKPHQQPSAKPNQF